MNIRILSLLVILGFFFSTLAFDSGLSFAQTDLFENPTRAAPSGANEPFISTGTNPQTKQGSLILDHPNSPTTLQIGPAEGNLTEADNVLALNGEETTYIGVPLNAIDIETQLMNNAPPAQDKEGFSSVRAQANQQWAFAGIGDGRSITTEPWVAGLLGDAGDPAVSGQQTYGVRGAVQVNQGAAYAVYGFDDFFDATQPANNSSAAKFEGKRTAITGDLEIGDAVYKKKLCLNGQDPQDCITTWDPSGSGFEFLKLQANGAAGTEQLGSVNVAGNGKMGSVVLGPTTGIATSLTEGDGSCNNGEVSGSPDCL